MDTYTANIIAAKPNGNRQSQMTPVYHMLNGHKEDMAYIDKNGNENPKVPWGANSVSNGPMVLPLRR
jgi:hypothetical protein